MKILVMGGTLFVGRVFVEQALAAGHDVTLFTRGVTNPGLFAGDVEAMMGDRNDAADVGQLGGRAFDLVVDTSGYVPRQVTAVVDVIGDSIGHYAFVSSASVYDKHDEVGADESAKLESVGEDVDVDDTESVTDHYGGLKALCEAALDRAIAGRCHHLRAGLIVGPYDNTGRFPYWVDRIARGGKVLAPEPKELPVQLIDVRDLADWILLAADRGHVGPTNAVGDPGQMTMVSMLTGVATVARSDAELTWLSESFLIEHDVAPFSDLPFWLPPETLPTHVGFLSRSNAKARAAGLTLRPFDETVAATLAWLDQTETIPEKLFGVELPPAGLTPDRELELLDRWAAKGP